LLQAFSETRKSKKNCVISESNITKFNPSIVRFPLIARLQHTARSRTARNAAAIALSTLLSRGIQFGWVLALARLLDPASFGIYGTIGGLIATAATLPEFGIGLLVLRDVPQRPERARPYLATALIVQPLLAIAGIILLIGVGLIAPYDTPTRLLLALASISLITDALGNIYYSQLIAAERMGATSLIAILHILLLIGFVFAVLVTGGGLAGLYIATIAAGVMRWLLHWLAARQAGIRAQWPFDRAIARHFLRDGWPIRTGNFMKTAYQHVDKAIVLATIGEREAGYLTAAFVVVFGVTELLNTTILVALFPMMSRMAQDTPERLRGLVDKLVLLTLGVALPMALFISIFAPLLAGLLFPGYVETAAVLAVLIWHTLPVMAGNLYAQLLVIEHRQIAVLNIRAASLAINIALNLWLLPQLGVQGAAVAALFSELFALVGLYIARRAPLPVR
jgi:O-antigen/teichoic acid export membrane protein